MDVKLTDHLNELKGISRPETFSYHQHSSCPELAKPSQLFTKVTPATTQITDSLHSTFVQGDMDSCTSLGSLHENMTHMRTIDSGSFGKVDLYKLANSNDYVAQKTIVKAHAPKKLTEQKRMFEREVSALKAMLENANPHVLKMIGSKEDAGAFYILTDYIKGKNFLDVVKQLKGLSENTARHYMKGIVEGVGFIHQRNVAHRDLKHENIMIDQDDNPVIIDFGLSRTLNNPDERMRTECGSLEYVAPEVYAKKSEQGYQMNADDFSLGVILLTSLLHEHLDLWQPGKIHYPKEAEQKIERLLTRFLHQPVLKDFLEKTLEFNPKKRLSTYTHTQHLHPDSANGMGSDNHSNKALHPNITASVVENPMLAHPWLNQSAERDQPKPNLHAEDTGKKVNQTVNQETNPNTKRRKIFFGAR